MQLTKPVTRILPSRPFDGPVGAFLPFGLGPLRFFLMPPTGATVAGLLACPGRETRRPLLPPRAPVVRRVEMISSRDLSSLADILMKWFE